MINISGKNRELMSITFEEMETGCKNLECPRDLYKICKAQAKKGCIACNLLIDVVCDMRGYRKEVNNGI
jgi:hypothetical protein